MNTNTDPGWNEVGDRLGSLGLKLKYHAEQAVGTEGRTVNDALDGIRDAIEEAFAALRGVVTDPAIRDDVKSVADGVAQAIATTLREGLKHPGSIVKRAAPKKPAAARKATPVAKVVAAKTATTPKVGAVKKAAPAKKSAKR